MTVQNREQCTSPSLSNNVIVASSICRRVLPYVPADITLTAYSYERILAEKTNADLDRHAVGLRMLVVLAVRVMLPAADHTVHCEGGLLPSWPTLSFTCLAGTAASTSWVMAQLQKI